MEERYFGRISFPNSDKPPIENVWFTIQERKMYVEIPASLFNDDSWAIVHGEFSGFGPVTFLGTRMSGGVSGSGGSFRKMFVYGLIKGIHLTDESELMFKKVILQSPALLNWLGFHHGIDLSNDGKVFTLPEVETVFEEQFEGLSLSITLRYGYTKSNHETNIQHYCNVMIEFPERQSLEEFRKKIYLLKKFVLFITNADPNFSAIVLTNNDDEFLEWIVKYPVVDQTNFSANIDTHYYNIKDQLQPLLKLWFKSQALQDVVDLLLEKYFNTTLSMPRYFQNMCVAIETFHYNFIQKDIKPPAEIVDRRNQIISLLKDEPENKTWFEERSKEWLKPTLADRLNYFKDKLSRIVGETIDCNIDDLITKIKQTRNEIVHMGVHYKRFNSLELILIGKALEFTIKTSILEQVGVVTDREHGSMINYSASTIRNLAEGNNYTDHKNRLRRQLQ